MDIENNISSSEDMMFNQIEEKLDTILSNQNILYDGIKSIYDKQNKLNELIDRYSSNSTFGYIFILIFIGFIYKNLKN